MSQADQHNVRVSDGRDNRKERLEFNKLRKRLRRHTGKAIADFNMIEAGDRIMVCISGGKDSHAMLDLLISLRSSAPIDFEIVASSSIRDLQRGYRAHPNCHRFQH